MADILGASSTDSNKRPRFSKAAVAGIGPKLCERLRVETLHLCATSGCLLGASGPFQHAPCSLLPYPFPAQLFEQALTLAVPFNTLIDRVARDIPWLTKVVRTTVAHDPFTRRLLEQLEKVEAEGVAQPLQLSINRSDYMIDQPDQTKPPSRILQVELNTVSVSFVSLGAKMTDVHTHSMGRLACDADAAVKEQLVRGRPAFARLLEGARDGGATTIAKSLPQNHCTPNVARSLALAHAEYLKRAPGGAAVAGAVAVVVMVVQPNERNVIDQRGIEHALWDGHAVPLVRATLRELSECATLGPQKQLVLASSGLSGGVGIDVAGEVASGGRRLEASVVYFRAGYTPDDYPGESEWDARLLVERSLSVKCPSLAQHLAGTKKVQQQLAAPGELERFTRTAAEASLLRGCFARLYGLDDQEEGGAAAAAAVDAIVAEARGAPGGYVLKPQREGGGNNLYGAELAEALGTMSRSERASFILMERIRPPTCSMPLMREGELDGGECTCELGVYGVMLSDGAEELVNECAGHLLRVKLDGVDEGGVCAGFAVLSSPLLHE